MDDILLETFAEFCFRARATAYAFAMFLPKLLSTLFWTSLVCHGSDIFVTAGESNRLIKPYKAEALQDIVTWDEHSIFVRGERIMLFNGEFHPYRLPVPDLWLDVFQKLRAVGFSGVSFYTDWVPNPGEPCYYC